MWQKSSLFKVGTIGAIITAICCFTPIFVVVLSAVGFGAIIGYLDVILIPALIIFIAIIIYAVWQERK